MHTVSVSFIKSPQRTASQKCIATDLAPRRMARHGHISFCFLKNKKNGYRVYQRPFVKDTACLMFLMLMMVVSSLVEVGNMLALVHTRDLD